MTYIDEFLETNVHFLRACLNDAACRAGSMILEDNMGTVLVKDDDTPCTEADVQINKEIIRTLCTPSGHGYVNNFTNVLGQIDVIGEEISDRQESADWQLIINPIDGTAQYVAGIPLSTVLITLCHEWEPQVAVVYDPHTDTLINAAKGYGVYSYNGIEKTKHLRFINQTPFGQKRMIGVEVWPESDFEWLPQALPSFIEAGFNLQILNSVGRQHMSLIEGHLAAVIFAKSDIDDMLPGYLATVEMGGVASDLYGQGYDFRSRKMLGSVLSASHDIHNQIMGILGKVRW